MTRPGAGQLALASTLDVPLATVTPTAPLPWNQRGYGLLFPADGNPAGARLRVDFRGGGNFTSVCPGARILCPFDGFDVYRAADGQATGTARLYVLTRPDAVVELGSPAGAAPTAPTPVTCGPGGVATQVADSAAGNVPTAAGDGFSLVGVEACRLRVSAPALDTLGLPGTIRWWLYETTAARWVWTEDMHAPTLPAAAQRDWYSADVLSLLRGAGSGARWYPEVVSWPVTGGDPVLTVVALLSGRL